MAEAAQAAQKIDEGQLFWDGAARGVFMLKKCIDTGRFFHYPRERSPFTGGATEWVEASGRGEIYACSVAYRASPPYCIAYIALEEGPIVLSNVLAEDLAAVAIGQRVEAIFIDDGQGRKTPFFSPA